ncbi:hypothetical protein [Paraburkholderia terricola]|jgi:hypothetical protein|uniref:hypothetical protein n=1 Tax=Paraburkholderia terricola TaxID=169427 RepID=UPI003ECCD987
MNEAMANDVTRDFVRWSEDAAIKAAVQVARDPAATAAQRRDAHKYILLLVGAIDGFKDSTGEQITTPKTFLKLHPTSPYAPVVQSALVARNLLRRAAR